MRDVSSANTRSRVIKSSSIHDSRTPLETLENASNFHTDYFKLKDRPLRPPAVMSLPL